MTVIDVLLKILFAGLCSHLFMVSVEAAKN